MGWIRLNALKLLEKSLEEKVLRKNTRRMHVDQILIDFFMQASDFSNIYVRWIEAFVISHTFRYLQL